MSEEIKNKDFSRQVYLTKEIFDLLKRGCSISGEKLSPFLRSSGIERARRLLKEFGGGMSQDG